MKIKNLVAFFFALLFLTSNAQAIHFGIGYTSVADGRIIPGLNAGLTFGKSFMLTGMAAGVATSAYYANSYTLNALYVADFGKSWMGNTTAGIGFGGMYSKKGLLVETKEEDDADKEKTEHTATVGPSFRVAINPFSKFYVAFEYMMGLGGGALGLGFGDTGIFALGVEI